MAPYRVGVALLRQAERQLAWIDENRADLQPVPCARRHDGLVRLVVTFDAMSEADAIEQITELFEKAARETGHDVSPSRAGPIGMHAWKVGDDPPPECQPG